MNNILRVKYDEKQLSIMKDFLLRTSKQDQCLKSFANHQQRILAIQRRFRLIKQNEESRIKILKIVWDKEINMIE